MLEVYKLYRCKNKRCGLVLGLVVHDNAHARATHLDVFRVPRGINVMELYRHSPTDFVVTGLDQGTVQCTCGTSRKWDAGEDALERLFAKRMGNKETRDAFEKGATNIRTLEKELQEQREDV